MKIIKKYNNRCLYDTELSTHITLNDLKTYVMNFTAFKVIDAKSKEDITRVYLIQIILELEGANNPLFTQDSLEHIIRFYGDPLQTWIQKTLEQSLNLVVKQQNAFQEMGASASKEDFIATLSKLTAKNVSLWQELWGNAQRGSREPFFF